MTLQTLWQYGESIYSTGLIYKSLFDKPYKVLSLVLTINLKNLVITLIFLNQIPSHLSLVTARVGYHKKEAGVLESYANVL